ncbi:hypothetical protein EIK77_010099 [Talaromyces pinophilus]|nr:hypothetical protein EIK77_010099 [Talaromyces pinophilus]
MKRSDPSHPIDLVATAVFTARRRVGTRRTTTSLVVLSSQSFETLLLSVGVDICANNESNNVEEWNPGVLGEEVLGKGQRDGRCDPADFHDGHETGAHGGADLVESAGSGDNGHGDQVYRVLDGGNLYVLAYHLQRIPWVRTYNQIANQDLQNLGLQTRPARKDLLQNSNENVAHGRTDEHSVERHLRHAGAEVMAMLADIMSEV